MNSYVCKCYKHHSYSSSIDSKINPIGNVISFYDGRSWTLITRVSHTQKSNENEIIANILWDHWVLYDSALIFLQLDILK